MTDSPAPTILGMATNYGELIDLIVLRRKELGLSQIDLDDLSGLQSGYTGKIEAWRHPRAGRGLGAVSLPLVLETLGLRIALVAEEPPAAVLRCGETRRRRAALAAAKKPAKAA